MFQKRALRVLLVEPNEDLRSVLATLLELAGCTVEIATNGAEALASVTASVPDVVMMELILRDADGLCLAQQIRACPSGDDVALVALTCAWHTGIETEVLTAGFVGFLMKPAGFYEIESILQIVAEKRVVR